MSETSKAPGINLTDFTQLPKGTKLWLAKPRATGFYFCLVVKGGKEGELSSVHVVGGIGGVRVFNAVLPVEDIPKYVFRDHKTAAQALKNMLDNYTPPDS